MFHVKHFKMFNLFIFIYRGFFLILPNDRGYFSSVSKTLSMTIRFLLPRLSMSKDDVLFISPPKTLMAFFA